MIIFFLKSFFYLRLIVVYKIVRLQGTAPKFCAPNFPIDTIVLTKSKRPFCCCCCLLPLPPPPSASFANLWNKQVLKDFVDSHQKFFFYLQLFVITTVTIVTKETLLTA